MKRPTMVFSLVAACYSVWLATPVTAQHALDGHWEGSLEVAGQVLTIAVDFESTANGLGATIDIPQQGATGIPLVNVRYDPPAVHLELPAGPGLAVFDGSHDGDSITGEFTQAGLVGTFALARATNDPDDTVSHDSLPYLEEDVTFANGDVTLAGTLTRPPTPGPHPAVVLISGSGPQNRDEELFGFKLFQVVADHLTRQGIAVLRYDDRGVGGSTGSVFLASTEDFAQDVLAAVSALRARADIDGMKIGLVGHSEGAIVAPLAATMSQDVAFIVLLAGTAISGEEILYAQGELIARVSGASDEEIGQQKEMQRRSFMVVRADSGWEQLEEYIRDQVLEAVDAMPPNQRDAIRDLDAFVDTRVKSGIQPIRTPWFRHFLDYDPVPVLQHVRVPVLALFGELDLQVPHSANEQPMRAALAVAGNDDVTIRVLPRANHLFLTAVSGSPAEYATMEKVFVPGFLETIGEWIAKRVGL